MYRKDSEGEGGMGKGGIGMGWKVKGKGIKKGGLGTVLRGIREWGWEMVRYCDGEEGECRGRRRLRGRGRGD